MTTAEDYSPSRGLVARIRRRVIQRIHAAPALALPARPVLSVTFDDFPKSAIDGAGIVARHGGSAGLFACTGNCGARRADYGDMYDADDLALLANAGHEIGAHSHRHPDFGRIDIEDAARDLDQQDQAFARIGYLAPVESFAYPFGEVSLASKPLFARRYLTARGGMAGLNRGRVDRTQLRAVELGNDAIRRERALRAVDAAARRTAWLIVFTHDVGASPSDHGVTPAHLEELCRRALDQGFMLLAPAAAARACGVHRTPARADARRRPHRAQAAR